MAQITTIEETTHIRLVSQVPSLLLTSPYSNLNSEMQMLNNDTADIFHHANYVPEVREEYVNSRQILNKGYHPR